MRCFRSQGGFGTHARTWSDGNISSLPARMVLIAQFKLPVPSKRQEMPRVCNSSRRASQTGSFFGPGLFQHTTTASGPASCRRPWASTGRGGGSRAPSRTPSTAAASVVATPVHRAGRPRLFWQPCRVTGTEGGGGEGVLFSRSAGPPPLARRTGPSRSFDGGDVPSSGFGRREGRMRWRLCPPRHTRVHSVRGMLGRGRGRTGGGPSRRKMRGRPPPENAGSTGVRWPVEVTAGTRRHTRLAAAVVVRGRPR